VRYRIYGGAQNLFVIARPKAVAIHACAPRWIAALRSQ
jgi:hypothetical protein